MHQFNYVPYVKTQFVFTYHISILNFDDNFIQSASFHTEKTAGEIIWDKLQKSIVNTDQSTKVKAKLFICAIFFTLDSCKYSCKIQAQFCRFDKGNCCVWENAWKRRLIYIVFCLNALPIIRPCFCDGLIVRQTANVLGKNEPKRRRRQQDWGKISRYIYNKFLILLFRVF